MSKNKPDDYLLHELLSYAYMTGFQIDEMMRTHPVAEYYPEIRKKINKASKMMAQIYMMCGELQTDKDE